ncbi:hypothetical protein FRB94_005528 [Tulasnella sp. JGI-2019a]|nr:hypothetical protein FRB94_005528 [Tulasnella sp. JGI-2019a]
MIGRGSPRPQPTRKHLAQPIFGNTPLRRAGTSDCVPLHDLSVCMSSTRKVMICGDIVWAHDEVKSMLGGLAEVVRMDSRSRAAFYEDLEGKYAGTVAIYRHNSSASYIDVFDEDLISHLPESVKLIGHNGAGYDQIDVNACARKGITVTNTPGAVDIGTATTALYLLISTVRQYSIAERQARTGDWKNGLKPAHDPSALSLGILGLGGIGLTLAKYAHGFPMKATYYYSRNPVPDCPDWIEYCHSMEELLQKSDVISLHVPLKPETTGLIGKKEFAMMKKGAILINTARGKVLDEEALIDALKSGQLSAAGLDVYPDEPKINPALLEFRNVTLLPHMGTETQESQKTMEIRALENIRVYLTGGTPRDIIPECQHMK